MADKKYSIDFTMSDGSTESVEFVAPQGEKGENGKTPYVQDGYWYIDGVNTGVKAKGTDGKDGEKGEDGASGVYVGSDTPDTDANVWIDPSGSPTGSAEEWTFTLEDGSTVKKTIAVLG